MTKQQRARRLKSSKLFHALERGKARRVGLALMESNDHSITEAEPRSAAHEGHQHDHQDDAGHDGVDQLQVHSFLLGGSGNEDSEMTEDESTPPTAYDELVSILQNLPVLVREKRRRKGLTIGEAEELTGIALLARVEAGQPYDVRDAIALVQWVATDELTTW